MSRSSASASSSSGPLGSLSSLGSLPSGLRFDGSAQAFPSWKFTIGAYKVMLMHKLKDVVEQPRPRKRAAAAAAAVAAAQAPAASAAAPNAVAAALMSGASVVNAPDTAAAAQAAAASAAAVAANDVQSAADQAWDERADRAFGLLVLCFTSPTLIALARTVEMGDAHALWTLLMNRYERKTIVSQAHVMESFLQTRMDEDEAVDAFVARLKNNVELLASMNEQPSETMQKHILIAGVKELPMFATIVQTLSLQSGVMSFDTIVTHLVDHQERMRRKAASGNRGGDVALCACEREPASI